MQVKHLLIIIQILLTSTEDNIYWTVWRMTLAIFGLSAEGVGGGSFVLVLLSFTLTT